MILQRSTDPRWLSNSWLVAAGRGQDAVVIDAGAPPEPLLALAKSHSLHIALVVLTHHHGDHVSERAAFEPAGCAMHPLDAVHVAGIQRALSDGEHVSIGDLELTMLHVPGHTRGQINVLVQAAGETPRVFTGDTLFRGSVGGTKAPGHGTFAQLRHSILDRLLTLEGETLVHPGHGDDTTIARERDHNPFVRGWTGADATLDEACVVSGTPATLLTWARDYDGGHKAWVRWADGSEDTVGGSRVQRA